MTANPEEGEQFERKSKGGTEEVGGGEMAKIGGIRGGVPKNKFDKNKTFKHRRYGRFECH